MPSRHDLNSVNLVKLFRTVQKIESYIDYVAGDQRFVQDSFTNFEGLYDKVYTPAIQMFCPDMSYVLHALNSEFFASIELRSSVPLSRCGLQSLG